MSRDDIDKERIIKGLNLKSLEVKKRYILGSEKVLCTEVIFDNCLCGVFVDLPEKINEEKMAHVRNILESLNELDTSVRKTFRENWEITNGDTVWDKFSSYVNLDDISLYEIIFFKDLSFVIKYAVPGAGEEISGDITEKYFIVTGFDKYLKLQNVYFIKHPPYNYYHHRPNAINEFILNPKRERIELILSTHNLEPFFFCYDTGAECGYAVRKEPEGNTYFKFKLKWDEFEELENLGKIEGTDFEILCQFARELLNYIFQE